MERSILVHMKEKYPKDATVYMVDAKSSSDPVNTWTSLGMISRFEIYADSKSLYPQISMSLPAMTMRKDKKPKFEDTDFVFFIPQVLIKDGNQPQSLASAVIGLGKKSRSKKLIDNIEPVPAITKCRLVIDANLRESLVQIDKYDIPGVKFDMSKFPHWVDISLIKV